MRPPCLLFLLFPLLLTGCSLGPRPARPVDGPAFLPVTPTERVTVGTVSVDRRNRCVVAEGWVNQVEGLVELLACGPEGKTHESVLVLQVDPVDLNAALLLLGLRPGTPPRSQGVGQPAGQPVDVWVEWGAGVAPVRARGEALILNRDTDAPLPATSWVYTGSVGDTGQLKATLDESLVATFWDPWALLNLPLPCGADDEALFAHTAALPPLGTRVTVRLQPVPAP